MHATEEIKLKKYMEPTDKASTVVDSFYVSIAYNCPDRLFHFVLFIVV